MSGRRETRIDFAVKLETMQAAERLGAQDGPAKPWYSVAVTPYEACRKAGHRLGGSANNYCMTCEKFIG